MYGGGRVEVESSPPDSVATETTPPGSSPHGNPLETRSQLESHIAAIGIPTYVRGLDKKGLSPSYLAWEEIRKNGAAELVGKVFGFDGKPLPYTGFEGYFVGESPARIVEIEESLGEHILKGIHFNFRIHDAPSGLTEPELIAALYGKGIPTRHVNEIMQFYDCLFREVLAEAKAIASPEKYERFRAGTYQRIESGQALTETVNSLTRITIATPRETEAYKALAEIGIFGHPGLRVMHEPKHEKIAGDGIFAMRTFPAQVNTSGGDDNPLSR
jgi:hypothetical protein